MEDKCFWLHIKKCGGESFRETLSPFYVQTKRVGRFLPFVALPKEEWNDALNNYRMPLGPYDYKRMQFARKFLYSEKEFREMYKFVIVRNPYDRIVSAWKYLFGRNWLEVRRIRKKPSNLLSKASFVHFLSTLPEIWETRSDREIATHTAPIWPDITTEDGRLLVDDIFHLEQIGDCVEELNNRFDLDIDDFEHINVNRKTRDYRRHYNDKSRALVEELFGDDIRNLDYTF